jgi:hypothetical protein
LFGLTSSEHFIFASILLFLWVKEQHPLLYTIVLFFDLVLSFFWNTAFVAEHLFFLNKLLKFDGRIG